MPDLILRHGMRPAVDASELWLGGDSGNLAQLPAHDLDDLIVAQSQRLGIAGSAHKYAQQSYFLGRSVLEFIVDEGARHRAPRLVAGNKKTRALQCGKSCRFICQSHGESRAVADLVEQFDGALGSRSSREKPCAGMGGQGENHLVEFLS